MRNFFKKIFPSGSYTVTVMNIRMIWRQHDIVAFVSIVPVLLCVFIPGLFLIAACLFPETSGTLSMKLATVYEGNTDNQILYDMFVRSVTPLLFTVSSVITAGFGTICVFVSEKEHRTLENLMHTPITPKRIFRVKFNAVVINTFLITIVGAVFISLISIVGCLIMKVDAFFTMNTLVEYLLMVPAAMVLSILITYLLSRKMSTVLSSVSGCGYVGFFYVILYIGEFGGFYSISWRVMLFISFVNILVDILFYRYIIRKIEKDSLYAFGS